ncbi:MAG TPA: hypothetical protein VMW52_05410, partial [Phycisphaerae bacterium]|nr:hypothetical protein [Phycisphaerae bacterium]
MGTARLVVHRMGVPDRTENVVFDNSIEFTVDAGGRRLLLSVYDDGARSSVTLFNGRDEMDRDYRPLVHLVPGAAGW